MKNSRPRLVCAFRHFSGLSAPVLGGLLLVLILAGQGSARAAASRSRHAFSHPLSSSYVETSVRGTSGRSRAAAQYRSATAGARRNGAGPRQVRIGDTRHSRLLPPDRIPMQRAGRRAPHRRAAYAHLETPQPDRSAPRHAHEPVVAEVTGRTVRGAYVARLRGGPTAAKAKTRSRSTRHDAMVVVASAPVPSHTAAAARGSHLPSRAVYAATNNIPLLHRGEASNASAGIYAEGVSHPEDDERLPLPPPSAGRAFIGTAEAVSAPSSAPGPPPRLEDPVVSGFGSEVAVASPGATNRPGGTRRRNHPFPASILPEDSAPISLADREEITDAAVRPAVLPELYDRSGRLLMPAPLKGSHEVLVHQNTMAASDGLERIQDDEALERLRAQHQLVSFPVSESLRVNEDLPYNRRYARPWTVLFAQDIARDFFARFHQPLQVNSAVRTVSYQLRLQRVNGNAAAIDGDAASPHLTGQAIDLGKRNMSAAELAWMRDYLLPLMQAGKIDVEEEFQQACFHISVYRRYANARRPVHEFAQLTNAGTAHRGGGDSDDQP